MGTQSGQKQIVTVPGATTMTPVAGAVPDQPEVTQATQVKPAIPNQPQQLQQVQQVQQVQQPQLIQQPQRLQQLQQPQPSLLMTSLTSPPKTLGSSPAANQNSPSKAPVTQPPTKSPDKFELTTDYIQQTIQQALKKDNLSPEIEQKLLALQQHNQEHDPPLVSFNFYTIKK